MSDFAISERDRLQHFLDQQRKAVLAIIEGLDDVQLNTPVLPSGWTPITGQPLDHLAKLGVGLPCPLHLRHRNEDRQRRSWW